MKNSMKKKNKVYRSSKESWFYKTFIKNTVNDNFNTTAEVLAKESNKQLIKKIKEIKIEKQINNEK